MKQILILTWLTAALLMTGCGGDSGKDELASGEFTADSYLPGTLSGIALQTMTVLTTRSQVTDYVGSASEDYLQYHLVGMAAALYDAKGTKISVEIAQFATATDAYGFYARLRPDNIALTKLGAEAYQEGNSLYFTQGQFAVTLSASGDSPTATDQLNRLAVTISVDMGAAGAIPAEFALFPKSGLVPASYRYFPSAYFGVDHVDRVFTCRQTAGADTLTLFLARDEQGVAYLALKETVKTSIDTEAIVGLGFDEDYVIACEVSGYGQVVAGLAEGYFVGAYDYEPSRHESIVKNWLTALGEE